MFKFYLLLIFFFSFLISSQAQNSAKKDTVSSVTVELGEVVVNASKANQKIKDLPIAVSVVPSQFIEENNITSLNQLNALTPNFVMPDYGSKLTSPLYIRGIGSRINSPSVGLYVDHVPYFEKSSFQFDFFGLEKIEVLRGPQGTLYGRNSMGGIINIITKSPWNYQGTDLKISAGTYGSYNVNVANYSKLNDKFAFSVDGNFMHNDGYYTNYYLNSKVDKLNSIGLRGKLIYKFTDRLKLEFITSYEDSKQGGYPYSVYNTTTQKADSINYNQYSSYDRVLSTDALNLNMEGESWQLTNTASYQYLDDKQGIDQDFSPLNQYFVTQLQNQDIYTDEIIFQSKNHSRYKWLFGGFGFIHQFDTDVDVNYYPTNLWYLKTYDKSVSGVAFFHQSIYDITPNLTFTAGIRYDSEKSKLHYYYDYRPNGVQTIDLDTIYPSMKDDIFLPKFALNYKQDNFSMYASYSKGYKPGGFNTTFERPQDLTFKNEDSHNYEIGFKHAAFHGLLHSEVALFYTKLTNQQIYLTAPSGRGSYLDNAGKSENRGFEISLLSKKIAGFEGMLSYGYTHSEILEYQLNATTDYNGNYNPYVPKSTFSSQLIKTIDVKSNVLKEIKISALYSRMGTQYWNLSNTLKEDPYHLLNAKVSLIKDHFQLDFWSKNILNAQYNAFLFEALGKAFVQESKPITFGVDFSYKF